VRYFVTQNVVKIGVGNWNDIIQIDCPTFIITFGKTQLGVLFALFSSPKAFGHDFVF
jgi:hypothetical protein